MTLPPRFREEIQRLERPMKPRRGTLRRRPGAAPPLTAGKQPHLAPIVTIFGAGIAGLSAAHELIERGFYVQVVESKMSPDEEYAVEVGGLARNQFGRVRESPELLHAGGTPPREDDPSFLALLEQVRRLRSGQMQRVLPRFPTPWRIRFERTLADKPSASTAAPPRADSPTGQVDSSPPKGEPPPPEVDPGLTDEWGVENATKLRAVWSQIKRAYQAYRELVPRAADGRDSPQQTPSLAQEWLAREVLRVEIRGHSNGDDSEAENRRVSQAWAEAVTKQLEALNVKDPVFDPTLLNVHLHPVGVGSAEPLGDQRDEAWRKRSNRVEFRIVEQLIPGEHGYRFFPAFYRHLFDIMQRTPILDQHGHSTGETAFDRLVPTRELGIAVRDNEPLHTVETRRVRSLEELRRLSDLFLRRLGATHRDIIRFQTRLLKFLTSSPARREREYEQISWWTFLGGDDERGYSQRMQEYLMETSRALVAMSAEETDARSQGDIVAQLQLHYLKDHFDYTLNGPTSEVWLRPWKRYLKSQGVRFFAGELAALKWKGTPSGDVELIPMTGHASGWLTGAVKKEGPVKATGPESGNDVVARRLGRKVVIDVFDNDPGDYVILVDKASCCVAAAGQSAEKIARELAGMLEDDERLSVTHAGTQIVLQPRLSEQLDLNRGPRKFDRSPDSSPTRKIVELSATTMKWTGEQRDALFARLQPHKGDVEKPDATEPVLELGNPEWIAAGLLRVQDQEFEQLISDLERKWQREIVPCLELHKDGKLKISPPAWVRDAILGEPDSPEGDQKQEPEVLCPYFFRLSNGPAESPDDVASRAAADRPGSADWTRRAIWIQVRNAHGNLKITDDPMAEDPNDDYWSHREQPPAFRPDFYILALPLPEASTLLWRAEKARPGTLHGCLAEILDFDRWTGRRTATGTPIRPMRDADGRPPADYPLRDFAGVQYYFQNQVRIGAGHIYYPRAEWGLSSISQLAYWRERMSPAGPFIGQLSVDIGDFYRRAPARLGNRVRRSAWHSTPDEIAAEVWFQIRQGLDRERATILVAPAYYHLDQGLSFDHALGRVIRDRAIIEVKPSDRAASRDAAIFTVWLHGQRFVVKNVNDPGEVARRLARAINRAFPDAIRATVVGPDTRNPVTRIVLRSTIPEGAALLYVTDGKPGFFQVFLTTGHEVHRYSHVQEVQRDRKAVRDGLYGALVRDPSLPLVARKIDSSSGICLLPKGGDELPRIAVRNDQQQLRVIYGGTLEG